MRFFFLLLLFSTATPALEVKFLGVSSMYLTDGKDALLFDAPFTRANPLHWFNLKRLHSDQDLVRSVIERHGLNRLRGVFVSHHHVDHAVDVALMASVTGAKAIGDENLRRILPKAQRGLFQEMREGERIMVGDFGVTPFRISHGPLPLEFLFAGPVPENFDFYLYDYREGATWFYLIEHRDLKLVWNGSTGDALEILRRRGLLKSDLDLYVLGLGALSLKEQVQRMKGSHPFRRFVPVHFDNFILPYDSEAFTLLPFSQLDSDIEELRGQDSSRQWIFPKLGETLEIPDKTTPSEN